MISIHSRVVHLSHLKHNFFHYNWHQWHHYLPYPKDKRMGTPWQPTRPMESMQQLLYITNFIFSFMISIHSRVVHLIHLKEISAIFSIIIDITISLTQRASRWAPHGNQLCQWNQCNNSCLWLTLFLASWYQFTHVWSTSVISRRWAQFFPLQLTSMTSALRRYLTGIFCSY
jgi:hypothetical protein